MLAGADKVKDDVWKVHEQLSYEYGQAQEDYKRLRAVVDQLTREYEDSKELDSFRRYGMLKGMIKRTSMHLKVKDDANHMPITPTNARGMEEKRKREERLSGTI